MINRSGLLFLKKRLIGEVEMPSKVFFKDLTFIESVFTMLNIIISTTHILSYLLLCN